jgi:translation initiation factor 2A
MYSDTPLFKLTVAGITQFSVAPNGVVPTIATFVPPLNASPARIAIYCLPSAEPKCQKSFFKSDTVHFKWNAACSHLLTTAQSQQGSSYYGESSLHLMACDGSISCSVGTGGVSDAAWSPQGRDFIAIQGEQPAKAILYVVDPKDGLKAIRDFGEASRNTIRWSPHGRFLCLAGFGSLAGEMDFVCDMT